MQRNMRLKFKFLNPIHLISRRTTLSFSNLPHSKRRLNRPARQCCPPFYLAYQTHTLSSLGSRLLSMQHTILSALLTLTYRSHPSTHLQPIWPLLNPSQKPRASSNDP